MDEIRFEPKLEPQRFWVAGEVVVVVMHITAKGRRTGIAVETGPARLARGTMQTQPCTMNGQPKGTSL